jgi:hypothetical protein
MLISFHLSAKTKPRHKNPINCGNNTRTFPTFALL